MAKQNEGILFRRVRGRIIPIRLTKKGEGAIETASGFGASVAAGLVASKMVKKSAEIRVKASTIYRANKAELKLRKTGQGSFHFMESNQKIISKMKDAVKKRHFAARIFKARNVVLGAGAFIGASMISRGIDKMQKQENSLPVELGQDLASYGAALAASGLYYKSLGVGGLGAISKAVRRFRGFERGAHIPIKHKYGTLRFPGL